MKSPVELAHFVKTALDQASWNAKTSSSVPQPAGQIAADWYMKSFPDSQRMLYTIAHLLDLVSMQQRNLEQAVDQINELQAYREAQKQPTPVPSRDVPHKN